MEFKFEVGQRIIVKTLIGRCDDTSGIYVGDKGTVLYDDDEFYYDTDGGLYGVVMDNQEDLPYSPNNMDKFYLFYGNQLELEVNE